MKKVLLKISYDGSNYAGWQRQNNALSIQQIIEEKITKLTGEKAVIIGASRTDAGVHALDQTACFVDNSCIPAERFSLALNTLLPRDIRIIKSLECDMDFHPQYDAISKTYMYQIFNQRYSSALERNHSFHVPNILNKKHMNEAAKILVGTHDFASFQASGGTAKSTIRTIFSSSVYENNDFVIYEVNGNGFLYNMVRIIVGTLIEIGNNKIDVDCIISALKENNRIKLGATAPAQGLFLKKINYKNI